MTNLVVNPSNRSLHLELGPAPATFHSGVRTGRRMHDELTENILLKHQVPVNPNAKSLYTYGIGLISSTQVAVSQKRWFHFDGLGSTRALTDYDENVTDTYEFSAFGVLESSTGTSVNPFRYVGQWGYYDDGARGSQYGLLLLGVRYYSRATGRFLTWDEVSSINLYTYVRNAATAAIDPSGMLVEICVRELSLPFTDALGRAHWFFNTSKCGARGYESAGLMTGWKANAGGHAVNCVRIHVSPQEEDCICKEAKSVWAGGGSWFGGGPFGDPTIGEYHWKHHNCQDFVQTILYKCLGGVLDWPEMGACAAPRGAPRLRVPKPRVPTSCHPPSPRGTFGYG